MKLKTFLFVLCVLFCQRFAAGQTMRFMSRDTVIVSSLGEVITYDAPLINTGTDTLYFYIKRIVNNLPQEWSSSFCFDQNCYAPGIDSVATSPGFSCSPVPPDSQKLFALHVFSQIFPGTGIVKVKAVNLRNPNDFVTLSLTVTALTTGIEDNNVVPDGFLLAQNYPNPFNPVTNIKYRTSSPALLLNKEKGAERPSPPQDPVDSEGEGFRVRLVVYDLLGREVDILVNEEQAPGSYTVPFNASGLPSGTYIYELRVGSLRAARKMTLVK
jgi:hypothetical protein